MSEKKDERPSIYLRVAEAKQRDVGRSKVRLDSEYLIKIKAEIGDIVEVEGKRLTAAVALPAYAEDAGSDIIRMDGILRKNAGVSIGDKVVVRKAVVKKATQVKLAPVGFTITVDQAFGNYVKRQLIDTPLAEGNSILIPVLGQAMQFNVTGTKPAGVVIVTEDSNIQLLEKPVSEVKVSRITYEDIGGLHDEIQRIREMVELPLKHPELFKRLGIDPPKGVLLHGPPGCGKTLIAKAVANEADAHFVAINGPEIMSKYYGESEQRLREVFEEAKQHAPAIVFIDELDAIAPKREEVTGEVEKRVVAQLLALMDGLEARGDIIVVGATNRVNAIDPALRRPGRFDREIEIGVPDKRGRHEIMLIHTRNMPLAKDVDLRRLADITHGYVGADASALSREAAMKALRRILPELDLEQERIPAEMLEKLEVTQADFMDAFKEITPSALREVYIEVPTIHWEDVGGLEEPKQQLREAVEWPLTHAEVFKRMGVQPARGVLMYGPPGCGKTLLARAVATESEANFISVKGPEILSKWVGESEKAIREIFRKARMAAPCIVFFDEVDAITPMRGSGIGDSHVTERVISQILTELDGIQKLENVVIVAATNRPDILDPALLRPGRFDRLIMVPAPDYPARLEILRIKAKDMPLTKDVDLGEIARITENFAGSDVEALCREAAMLALRENIDANEVSMKHFNEALTQVKRTITEDMMKYYKGWEEKFRQMPRMRATQLISFV